MNYYAIVIILCIMSCVTVAVHTANNTVLEKADIKWFRVAFFLMIAGAVAEVSGYELDTIGGATPLLFSFVTLVAYSITPMIPIALGRGCGEKKVSSVMLALAVVHILIEFVMVLFGGVFIISVEGVYHEGPYYGVYTVACLISYIYLIGVIIYLMCKNKMKDAATLGITIAILCFGLVPSFYNSKIRTIFVTFVFAGMLLYMYLQNTNRQELEQTIGVEKHISGTDPLTGVSSRISFNQEVERIDQQIKEDITLVHFAICLCDLNDLKKINDNFGHDTGDAYIKKGCKKICDFFKHSQVFRVGGDEFVIIMKNEDYVCSDIIEQKIRTFLYEEIDRPDEGVHKTSFAWGISKFNPKEDRCVADVLKRADEKMYENKKMIKARAAGSR